MFLERTSSSGMPNSKYWNSELWNKGAHTINKLPNCTPFCVGETYEATFVKVPFQMFASPYNNPGAFPTAKKWHSLWIGDKGIEPKIGGVCVWGASKSNPDGHVAFVLETKDVGNEGAWIKVCQSNFGGKYFEVKEYTVKKGKYTQGVGCPYIGCCYNDVHDIRTERKKDLYQVKVLADSLHVRSEANGNIYAGRVCPKGIYTILDTVSKGEYTWAKLEEGFWIALNDADGWTQTYPPVSDLSIEEDRDRWKNAYLVLSEKYTELLQKYKKLGGTDD